jgi:1-acyl-sn-glycerol-3-phosphate acyltransferase
VKATHAARLRLAALWFSQVARVVADNALRVFVLIQVAALASDGRDYAWHLVAALLTLPGVVLAPLNGALSNTFPKHAVLTASAAYCALVIAIFAVSGGPWAACWGLVAVGAAIYSPGRYALLPAAATDTRMPLMRVNGWIEMGAVAGIVGGFALGLALRDAELLSLPGAVAAALALNLFAAASASFCAFPADVRRPESSGAALLGFFRDVRRIWAIPTARSTLLGMAVLRALVIAATGALIAVVLHRAEGLDNLQAFGSIAGWILAGAAAGSLLAGVQRHIMRGLGLVPLAATALALCLALAALLGPSPAICICVGAACGLISVPLAALYQQRVPADARGNAMSIRNFTDYVLMTLASVTFFWASRAGWVTPVGQLGLAALLAAGAAVWAWNAAHRETIEQLLEWIVWPLYRIRAHGAIECVPVEGPLLVIANHSAWMDPIWLAKVMPRRLFPMMSSAFYDRPGLRFLMRNVAKSIRVQESNYRREAPELQDAIAYLDRGRAVVIFPEGSLRRSETRPIRRFGQGVWHILQARPQTPVVVCWIEGGWGSYFSYFHGKPTKNKKFDMWRRIDVAVGEPMQIPPELLLDDTATRAFLETKCGQMRGVLGLPTPEPDNRSEAKSSPEMASEPQA